MKGVIHDIIFEQDVMVFAFFKLHKDLDYLR